MPGECFVVQAHAQIEEKLSMTVPIVVVFQAPNVRVLAQAIRNLGDAPKLTGQSRAETRKAMRRKRGGQRGNRGGRS